MESEGSEDFYFSAYGFTMLTWRSKVQVQVQRASAECRCDAANTLLPRHNCRLLRVHTSKSTMFTAILPLNILANRQTLKCYHVKTYNHVTIAQIRLTTVQRGET